MKKFRKYSAENAPKAWLYLLPALVVVAVFNIYPLTRAFTMSFHSGTMNNQVFAGLKNYQFVLKDPKFHIALKNTAVYAFGVVPASLVISIVIALLIFDKVKFKNFFETIFFIPYLTSTIAVGIVFFSIVTTDLLTTSFSFSVDNPSTS